MRLRYTDNEAFYTVYEITVNNDAPIVDDE